MRLIDERSGLELLPKEECLALLATQEVGRVVIAAGGSVDIFPVNYGMAGELVVFRTADGTKWRDGPGAAVAFEVDELDPATRSGWSVVIHGRLEPMEDDAVAGLLATPWAEGDKPHVLRLWPDSITGRRLPPR